MSVFVATALSVMVDTVEAAGFANKVTINGMAQDKRADNFAGGGWETHVAGLASFDLAVEGWQDYAATGIDQAYPMSGFGAGAVITVGIPGNTAGDTAYFGQGIPSALSPTMYEVGELAKWAASWNGTARPVRGLLLHPQAARTASGTGTAVAFTAPTAAESLYASFHVLSVTGTGTLVLKVQTDNGSGFPSAADRITSQTFTAVGREYASLAGSLSGETHMRASWTVSGFTSVTFGIAAGVAPT